MVVGHPGSADTAPPRPAEDRSGSPAWNICGRLGVQCSDHDPGQDNGLLMHDRAVLDSARLIQLPFEGLTDENRQGLAILLGGFLQSPLQLGRDSRLDFR